MNLAGKARPLFVAGCQRSGTTAFAECLNLHPRILLDVERYRSIPARTITPELFTFERILDYREETIRPREYYEELLFRKEPEKLEWIGGKNPNYLLHFDVLSENNPGARFIVLHRPVEEVEESWEVGSDTPDDPWRGRENGFERGVEAWNRALRKTREFVEAGRCPRVLIVSYHDFFSRNRECLALLSLSLGLEFDEATRRRWEEATARFDRARRPKSPLTEEQARFIAEHKDHAAEEWILARIDEQWKSVQRDAESTKELVRSRGGDPHGLADAVVSARAAAEDEAERARCLERRVAELTDDLAKETRIAERLERKNKRLALHVRHLREQIRSIRSSRSWMVLESLRRLRARLLALRRRTQ